MKNVQAKSMAVGDIPVREVPCPQCGSWDRTKLLEEDGRAIVRCLQCRVMFTSPQMTDEARIASLNTQYQPELSESQFRATAVRERARMDKTLVFTGEKRGQWLDVGCAAGVILSEAAHAGFKPFGFEVRVEYAQHLHKEKQWDVRSAPSLAEAGFEPHAFDVVSILDTLNYIPDPVAELKTIRELLTPDGLLLCRVPNTRYLLCKNVGLLCYLRFGVWSRMNTDYYLIHFTPESLRTTLKKGGFTIIHEEVGMPWMGGSFLNVLAKRVWFTVATFLNRFGLHWGVAIDVWARPVKTDV